MEKRIITLFLCIFLLGNVSAFNFGQTSTTNQNNYVTLINNDTELFHNNLSGKQGGTANQFYHLTEAIYNAVADKFDDWITGAEADTKIADANTSMKSYVDLLNTSGLIRNWNATGYIKDWNASGLIRTWSASDWNSSGLIRDWNSTGYIQNWSAIISSSAETNWNANYSDFLTGYNYATNGTYLTSYTETDPMWNDNFTKYNSTWSSITNTSYYLVSNPYAYYNSTTAPIYTNDTFGANYSNYSIVYAYAINDTNFNATGLIKDWNATGLIANWSADLSAYTTWANILNGTMFKTSDWEANYSANNDAWLNTTNITYNAYNSTGLIRDWNVSGQIKDWAVDIGNANTSLKN